MRGCYAISGSWNGGWGLRMPAAVVVWVWVLETGCTVGTVGGIHRRLDSQEGTRPEEGTSRFHHMNTNTNITAAAGGSPCRTFHQQGAVEGNGSSVRPHRRRRRVDVQRNRRSWSCFLVGQGRLGLRCMLLLWGYRSSYVDASTLSLSPSPHPPPHPRRADLDSLDYCMMYS